MLRRNPRGGEAALASSAIRANGRSRLAVATSARLYSSISVRMSVIAEPTYLRCVPGAAQHEAERSGALQTRDRPIFRACGGPGSAAHRSARAPRCTASGTRVSSHTSRVRDDDQAVEPAFGLAGIDRLGGQHYALLEVLGATGDDEARCRIHQRDIAIGALLALEHVGERLRVGVGVAAPQHLRLDPLEADLLGRDLETAH